MKRFFVRYCLLFLVSSQLSVSFRGWLSLPRSLMLYLSVLSVCLSLSLSVSLSLSLQGGTLVVQERDLRVRIREQPFAVGGMRHCFRMWNLGAGGRSGTLANLVGKKSRYGGA